MLGWLKRRQKEQQLAEAHEIAARVADRANEAMDLWEATCLQTRRTMLADSFDERLTGLEPECDLSFEELAEIEALALLKNWIERKQKVVEEISNFIASDDWECLKLLDAAEAYIAKLEERFDDVGNALAEDLERAIEEETQRRAKPQA